MTTQRIVLAWSGLDLEGWRRGDLIVALTAEAYVAGRKIPDAVLLDPSSILRASSDPYNEATQFVDILHDTVKSSRLPWIEAYANVILQIKIFQLITWLKLIRSLKAHVSPRVLEICPPKLFSGVSDIYNPERSFETARDILRREGIRFAGQQNSSPLSLKARLARACALLLGRGFLRVAWTLFRLNIPQCLGVASRECADVVLVSQQYTDAFHAVPLARRLAKAFGDRFRWVGPRPEGMSSVTEEEAALVANTNLEECQFIDSASLKPGLDMGSRRSMLLDLGSAIEVAHALSRQASLGVRRRQSLDLLLDPQFTGLGQRYSVWNRFLNELRPKVVVGLSTLQDMALVRAWTRRNNVPFVEFMHGVFPTGQCSYAIDADYLGVFGRINLEELEQSSVRKPRRVTACGAMQFGDKMGREIREGEKDAEPSSRNTVLFLGGGGWLPFYPWSPSDMWRMIEDIHRASHRWGRFLRVRPHPRYPPSVLAPYVEALRGRHPATIDLSSDPSLRRDLLSADFVIAPGFDGAVLDALLAKRLVISYVPTGTTPVSEQKPFQLMGNIVYGYDGLNDVFSEIVQGADRVHERQQAQVRYLKHYIEDSIQDSWGAAVKLVTDALDESASHLT
jgi:hypothetical protein